MYKMFGQFLLLNFKHQKDTDTNLQLPRVGEVVYFRHKEDKFQKYKSHMWLGLMTAVSSRSLDGVSRCVFIQATTRHEGDADDGDIPAGKVFIYHRKFSDVIPIQNSIDKLVNTCFSEDFAGNIEFFMIQK